MWSIISTIFDQLYSLSCVHKARTDKRSPICVSVTTCLPPARPEREAGGGDAFRCAAAHVSAQLESSQDFHANAEQEGARGQGGNFTSKGEEGISFC
ncbi:hypothetical protein E2C01_076071 [Portunus trituberculatus]|uniref:Uncharacterized protein n=1 Tax=Portunus trituberculatus TaxID=210409 RepID=A0A5B7IMA7_PORTR|nr:hypothetical protein [Portunus trituberculatus]